MHQYINIHTHKSTNSDVFEIINSNIIDNNAYYSIGIHPWDINEANIDYKLIEQNVKHKNVLFIGEIGLDRSIQTDFELQKQVFLNQLNIAKRENKPIIVHCVSAYSDFQQIVKQNPYSYIFHGFNTNLTIANYLITRGSYLSFGAELLVNTKLQDTFKQLSIKNIFFETDESDTNIKDIYIFAAKLLEINLSELQEAIQSNFKKVFGTDVGKLA